MLQQQLIVNERYYVEALLNKDQNLEVSDTTGDST